MRVTVAGGTGTVGSYVVEALQAAGHDPVALSRGRGVDVGMVTVGRSIGVAVTTDRDARAVSGTLSADFGTHPRNWESRG